MGSTKHALPLLDDIEFSCGWSFARFGFYSRLTQRSPLIFAREGQPSKEWRDLCQKNLEAVSHATRGFLETETVQAIRQGPAAPPHLAVVDELVRLTQSETPVSDVAANSIHAKVKHVLEPIGITSIGDWVIDALDERYTTSWTAPNCVPEHSAGDQRAKARIQVAQDKARRATMTGDLSLLDAGLRIIDEMLRASPRSSPRRTTLLNRLAGFLWERYMITNRIADLDRSIRMVRIALRETPTFADDTEALLNNLGLALTSRFEQTRNSIDIEDAIDALEEVTASHDDPEGRQILWWNNHANALRLRFHHVSHDLRDIEESERRLEIVVQRTPLDHADAGIHRQNLSNVQRERREFAAAKGSLRQIDASIEMLKGALDAGVAAPDRPGLLASLAAALRHRFSRTKDPADRDAAIDQYRLAMRKSRALRPHIVLQAGIDWGEWAFAREAWAEAVEAFEDVLALSQRTFHIQIARRHQELVLKRTQGVMTSTAYALAQLQRPEDAVAVLEAGLARMLSLALETGRRDLEQLRDGNHKAVYERYCAAAEALARSYQETDDARSGALLTMYQHALDEALEDIRQLPGFGSFLQAVKWREIVAASTDPVVYVFATLHGGLALVVDAGASIVPLPNLTLVNAIRLVSNHLQGLKARGREKRVAIAETLSETWRMIMAPISSALPGRRAHLIPVGRLQTLPLHAAASYATTAESSLRISYSPNIRSLLRSVQDKPDYDSIFLVKVSEYASLPPLPFVNLESELVSRTVGNLTLLEESNATRRAVTNQLGQYSVGHFCCHGSANFKRPLDSALYIAEDETVTVADVLALPRVDLRLVILSACETAVAGFELPDEVVSLPTGFLAAGATSVLSTLWAIDDKAAAIFIGRFYHEWKEVRLPSRAFFQTLDWIRSATSSEIVEFIEGLGPWDEEAKAYQVIRQLDKLPSTAIPYADPSIWAPFCWTGA